MKSNLNLHKKLNSIFALLICIMAFSTSIVAQVEPELTKAQYDSIFNARQQRLTEKCTEKMLQLLRDAPIVVEGKILSIISNVDHTLPDQQRQKYWVWRVLVSQKLKGSFTSYNDTLYFTEPGAFLDKYGQEIEGHNSYTRGLYQEKPIILMLKPNDDVNSPFYKAARKNYIAYDDVQPSIGISIEREDINNGEPMVYFNYVMERSPCQPAFSIKEFNKITKDIADLKSLQKKSPDVVSLRSAPTISNISPLESTAGTGDIITITGSGFGYLPGFVKFKNANKNPNAFDSFLSNLDPIYIKSWSDAEIKVEVPGVVYKGHENDLTNLGQRPLAASGKIEVWTASNEHKESTQSLNIKYAHRVQPTITGGVLTKAEPIYLATRNCFNGLLVKPHIELKFKPGAIAAMDTALHRWERKLGIPVRFYRDVNNNIIYTHNKTENDTFKVYLTRLPASASLTALMATVTEAAPSGYVLNPNYYFRKNTAIRIDSAVNWDYSITGNVPNSKTDFLDNFCHEMGHALQLNHDVDLTHGTTYSEILKNLMHFDKQPGTVSSARPNLLQHSDRAIVGARDMRDISMTKKWKALHTQTLAYNPPNQYDFLIEDHPTDHGAQPFWGPDDMWTSKAIWVRLNDDADETHQNPTYDPLHPNDKDYVNVKVKNIGCQSVNTGSVKAYWTKASTGLLWPTHWKNFTDPTSGLLAGDEIPPNYLNSILSSINPGLEDIFRFDWVVPNPNLFPDKNHHYCLLARVFSPDLPIYNSSDSIYLWNLVPYNSEVAWKNISIIDTFDATGFTLPTTVWVRPIMPLVINPKTTIRISSNYPTIFTNNEVVLHLKGDLYNKWSNKTGINAPTLLGGQKIQINANNTNLIFDIGAGERYSIDVSYRPNNALVQPTDLNIDLKQIENNITVGGERYEIRPNTITPPIYPLLSDENHLKQNVSLEISPNPVSSIHEIYADIILNNNDFDDLQLKIVSIDGKLISDTKVIEGKNTIKLNELKTGTYIATLTSKNKIIISRTFIIL